MIERYMGRLIIELKQDVTALAEALAAAGADVKGRTVRCPFCDDHRPSGGIYQAEKGGFRYKCHACGFNGSIIDVLAKVEKTEPMEVFRRLLNGQPKAASGLKVYATIDKLKLAVPGTVETVYPYTNPDTGQPDMIVLRFMTSDGKDFLQARPIEGGFVFEAPPKPWPLYNRGRLVSADTVIVVEGEKCVHTLDEMGIVATTSPGGANNAKSADWTPLAGKNIILWPDSDGPGKQYIDDAAEMLSGLEPAPRLSYIDPAELDLQEKEDAADFIQQLRALFDDPQQVAAEVRKALERAKPKGIANEMAEEIKAIIQGKRRIIKTPWVMLDHLSRALRPGTVCLLVGNPGGSKSFWILQLLAHAIEQEIKAAVYELEENRQYHLFRALAQRSGLAGLSDPEWIEQNPDTAREAHRQHADFLEMFGRAIHCSDSNMTLSQLVDWLENKGKQGFRLIAVDPVSASEHTKRESWDEDSAFIQRAKRIAVEYQTCILLVQHPVKVVSKPDLSQVAGGAALGRFVQGVLWLESHDEKTSQVKSCCGTTETAYNRTLHILKARNAKGTGCKLAFQFVGESLTFTELGLIVASNQNHQENLNRRAGLRLEAEQARLEREKERTRAKEREAEIEKQKTERIRLKVEAKNFS